MATDWDLVINVAGPILGAAVGAGAKHIFEARPRVVAFLQHTAGIPLPDANPPTAIGTHSIVLRNAGKRSATNVRLGHNTLPTYHVFPDIEHTVGVLPGGQREIRFPQLVPQKQITITYIYQAPLQWHAVNTHLEHDGGSVKVLKVLPTVQMPKLVIASVWTLAAVGLITTAYFAAQILARVYRSL